ncbi:unnamed protein product (macronuclear) [Paramecium tetraurelia]|uniref:Uncharacterized protein n=1 Tax=Paramecium tetraurelia TaxID=5888 RepID=A0CXQ0_PARTE|nr:uncharacterized protein GSPATT00011199001 [Paramecium tetraurelia]CAK75567.1 unnamed protein product [Paramecium tetraurelia]|eukprot:XP_001442964.1 hypothetical protein (macronuclear) [Paramecium tetraurelia strain d4-2]
MKIIEEIKNQVEQEMKKMIGKCIEKRYAKLTDKLKQEFIIKVVRNGQTIRQASKDLCINYSSAKAIMSNYRKSFCSGKQNINLVPRQVKVNDKYDWKKFKIQTYCEEAQTNEYTMETFAKHIKQSNQDKVLIDL